MRIRTFKPEIFGDDKFSKWECHEQTLFFSLISLSDDHGVLRNHPRFIAGFAFPSKPEISSLDIIESLNKFYKQGVINIYSHGDASYIHLKNWGKHQRVVNPGKAKLPPPPPTLWERNPPPGNGEPEAIGSSSVESKEDLNSTSGESQESLIKSSPLNREQGTGNREHIKQTPQTPQGAVAEDGPGEVKELLDHWNETTGQKRRRPKFARFAKARIKQGYSPSDIQMTVEWAAKSDHKRAVSLREGGFVRPETVLGSKFDDYFELAKQPHQQRRKITVMDRVHAAQEGIDLGDKIWH